LPRYHIAQQGYSMKSAVIYGFISLLFFIISPVLTASTETEPATALEKVTLQLKWKHQFQFAGYYAAKAQGYYQDEGLEVTIQEADSNTVLVQGLLNGDYQYAISDIAILADYLDGKKIRALAAIFQNSPLILISKQSSGIVSPHHMIGKRVMVDTKKGTGDATLNALLAQAGIDSKQFITIPPSFSTAQLINDEVDVMTGYLTTEPFEFKYKNIPINIISPSNYGINFYGDILFTSDTEIRDHPLRANRFRRASLKGWQYALDHPEEIIQLIYKHYPNDKSLEYLRFEAEKTRELILAEHIPLGNIDISRLQRIVDLYVQSGIVKSPDSRKLKNFTYQISSVNLNAEERIWLAQHPTIRLGIDKSFAPYEWLDENNRYKGITANFTALIEERLGIQFEVIKNKETWNDVLNAAKNQEIDMLSCLVKTKSREKYLNFSPAYINSSAVIITEQSNHIQKLNLEKLHGKRVAISKGHYVQELVTKDHPKIIIVTAETMSDALKLVATGQADAFVGDVLAASYAIKKENLLNLTVAGSTPYQNQFSLATSKHLPILNSIMQKALTSISEQEKEEIYQHWNNLKITEGISYSTLFKYIFIIILVFCFFAFWIYSLRKAARAQKESESRLQAILDHSPIGIWLSNTNSQYQFINKTFCNALGITEAQFLATKNLSDLVGEESANQIIASDQSCLAQNEPHIFHKSLLFADGKLHDLEITKNKIHNNSGKVIGIIGTSIDVTEKKKSDTLIWQQANFDSLTQLPNRLMFQDQLEHELLHAQREKHLLGLLFIDLDHFKAINDTLGHDVGDLLLIEASQRIKSCTRESDMVARLGGDEFTVILSDLHNESSIERVTAAIVNSLALPFQLNKQQSYISASIGITLYPNDGKTVTQLLQNADQAMYQAKKIGRNGYKYFTQSMQDAAQKHLQTVTDLRIAISEQQFQLYYQPIVNLTTGEIHKAEALIRWNHPVHGMVSPADFIPIAEDSGLIIEIGDWVFKEAARQAKQWQKSLGKKIQISINESPIQFQAKTNANTWIDYLKELNLLGESIVIEITEGLLMESSAHIQQQLLDYSEANIQVSMDDFGTGYSSLAYLNKFDIDYLKIDQSFTRNLAPGSHDMVLSEAIIVMAQKLGLKVIAEGIETEQQRQLLLDAGCDFGQGYLFSRPVPAEDFIALLDQH